MFIDISFTCRCGHVIVDTIGCPDPNFMAEKNRDSYAEDCEDVCCTECGKDYEVHVSNSFGGADCHISNENIDVSFRMPYYPENENDEDVSWLYERQDHLDILKAHLHSVSKLLEVEVDVDTKFSLLVMLHGHIVAAAEGFLSSVFIYHVTNSEELIRKLVESDPHFGNMNFTLNQLFKKRDEIKNTVASYLKDLIFHHLAKIKPMYKSVLGIDFGNISWLFSAVTVRHDCVHRAGYTKEGEKVLVTKESVNDLATRVLSLAEDVMVESRRLEQEHTIPF